VRVLQKPKMRHACTLAASLFVLCPVPEASAQAGSEATPQAAPAIASAGVAKSQPAALIPLTEILERLPQQPQITLSADRLQVVANNSLLFPILQEIARATGMQIINIPDGSPTVSGSYGPDRIAEVLADLISSAGYNFVMVGGDSQGVPRKLFVEMPGLSSHASTISRNGTGSSVSPGHGGAPQDATGATEEPLGPGAVRPTPADSLSDENDRVERNLQRLQHIEQQQEQSAPQ
jgi:hypothetical protein